MPQRLDAATLILSSGNCPPVENPSDLLPLYILTPSGNCGRSSRRLYPVANGGIAIVSCIQRLTVGSRVRQGGGQPPNARFVTEEKGWLCRNIPISGNGFSGFGEEGEEGAGVARGMRKQEADRLEEARALVLARQAHARTRARTHALILTHTRWTVQYQRYDPVVGHGGNVSAVGYGGFTHTDTHSHARANASKSCVALERLTMHPL